jgi:DNA-directed RNA polymerase specialized sigma24 family protein
VEKVPAEGREAVGLLFYHAWKLDEVAELLGFMVRTEQRRWQAALVKLL